ncbi:MAG: 50S ribosomal protein L17 [Candidatus Parcubacteria bacterium]|nr:50S ribosomal protein L17 [Candidatus Parcubacteria bacterium]
MRHRNVNKILDRKKGPRKALLRGLATNLILYEKIKTTDGKARAMKGQVEKLITKGKPNNLVARRYLLKTLYSKNAVKKVLEVLSPRYLDRKGGYLRITKLKQRQGDGANMVLIEFV